MSGLNAGQGHPGQPPAAPKALRCTWVSAFLLGFSAWSFPSGSPFIQPGPRRGAASYRALLSRRIHEQSGRPRRPRSVPEVDYDVPFALLVDEVELEPHGLPGGEKRTPQSLARAPTTYKPRPPVSSGPGRRGARGCGSWSSTSIRIPEPVRDRRTSTSEWAWRTALATSSLVSSAAS